MSRTVIWTSTLLLVAGMPALHAQTESDATNSETPRVLNKLIAVDEEDTLIATQRENKQNKGATGLDLPMVDTPQSVSIMDAETIEQFGFDEVNDVLSFVTGVNVESVETTRTYYNSRGFDIQNMQLDGIGLPSAYGLMLGSLDTALYERVEIVRGANGLLSGVGNPSGTVNYIRKRPTNELQADVEATGGSWDRKRVEGDVSVPLTTDGTWATRFIAVYEDKDSWLDLYHKRRVLAYGVIDGQLDDNLTVSLGASRQQDKSDGVLWGALPLQYSDGTQTDFDVSTSTSMDWTYADTYRDDAFAELVWKPASDWQLKTTLNYATLRSDSELFYTYGSVDRDTGLGLYGYPGKYDERNKAFIADVGLSGGFAAWDQHHDVTLGLSHSRLHVSYDSWSVPFTDPAWGALPAFPGWTGSEISRPAFGEKDHPADWKLRMNRLYGAVRLSVNDPLKLILGFNAINYEVTGENFGVSRAREEQGVSPYAGITWRVSPQLNLYASYSDIFNPQENVGIDLQSIGSAQGRSYETGLKGEWLDKKLLTTVAVFKSEQDNLAEALPDPVLDPNQGTYVTVYEGIHLKSQGYELEVAGRPHPSLKVQAGFTHLGLQNDSNEGVRHYVPRSTFKLLTSWKVIGLPQLELGASARWQSEIYTDGASGRITQPSYAVYGLNASYDINKQFSVSARVDNVTDEKYLTSLYWEQAYYASPRSVNVSAKWQYR